MGHLDDVMGSTGSASSGAPAQTNVMQAIEELVQSHGGVAGIVSKLNQAGLGQMVSSWVGTGANQPMAPGQVSQGLGADVLQKMAAKLGVPPEQASAVIAKVLPLVVDHFTPHGQVPQGQATSGAGDMAGMLSGLAGKLFR